ncbi:MAG: HEAT repeat domain-containing protein [Anaerolineae bacterium]|nr:HEAT repeat domain-containing protein [Anaerolineae bacterium]
MAVDAKLLKQIKHKDATERRKAIVALADSRDTAGVRALEDVAQNDSEPKLRELAARAAQHLQEQVAKAAARAANPESAYQGQKEIRVSEKQMARAREYVDQAMSMVVAKDNAKAVKALAKALQIDPSLKTDQYFLSLASNLFNTSNEEALRRLVSGDERGTYIKAQEQGKFLKRKTEHKSKAQEIGWASAVFDLTIYAVVVGIITFLAPIVFAQLMGKAIDYQKSLTPEKYQEETIKLSSQMEKVVKDVQNQSVGPLIVAGVVNGVGSAVSMVALCFLIHLFATKLLRGNGTMPFMMSQLVPFYSLMTPVFFIWSCLIMGMVSIGAGLFGVLCSPIMALASFVVLFKSAGRIGTAYDFGSAKGCMSLAVGIVALAVVSGILSSLIFGAALNNAMTSFGLA